MLSNVCIQGGGGDGARSKKYSENFEPYIFPFLRCDHSKDNIRESVGNH